ncbi:MAG: hypothetical protein FJ279_16365 [Planctomycetes bacterium]|nr:hypothetical protein [Planctomycetota bacterium]
MTSKREELLQGLVQLDDWNFLSAIQNALQERNTRNKREHKPPADAEAVPFLRFRPAQYVVALWEPLDSSKDESRAHDRPQLQALAVHSADQVDRYLEIADDPESWTERRMIDASNFNQGGRCNQCGIELCAAGKQAHCPICGSEVCLT